MATIHARLSTLTSSLFSPQPRCHSGRYLFSRQNGLWVAEMRLILIREPIITLLLLLSLMLTTASPPICLSFSTTISLCLPAWSLSHCQSARVSLCLPANLLPAFSVCLAAFPVSKHVLLSAFSLNRRVISGVITCFFACPSDTHIQECFFARRDKAHGSLGVTAQNKWPWFTTFCWSLFVLLTRLCVCVFAVACLWPCLTLCIRMYYLL